MAGLLKMDSPQLLTTVGTGGVSGRTEASCFTLYILLLPPNCLI